MKKGPIIFFLCFAIPFVFSYIGSFAFLSLLRAIGWYNVDANTPAESQPVWVQGVPIVCFLIGIGLSYALVKWYVRREKQLAAKKLREKRGL